MFDIFEHPWTLMIVAAIAAAIIAAYRTICPNKKQHWQLAIPVLIVLLAFGLDFLVKTDSEKIIITIDKAVKAVQNEDINALAENIAENYKDSFHGSKDQLIRRARSRLSKPFIDKNILRIISIEKEQKNAQAVVTIRVVFDKSSDIAQGFIQQMFVKLNIGLEKQPDNSWLINNTEISEINRQPTTWKKIRY